MGYELDKLLNWYGVTSPFLSQYTGTTDADQAAYDKYVADYKNRVSNTSMYGTAGQFASNAALPATTSPIKSAATTSTYSPYTNALGQFISTDISKPSLTTMLAKYGFTPPAANTPTQAQVNAAGQLQSQIDMEKAAAAVENAQTPITTPPLETLLPPPPAPVSTPPPPTPVEDLANKYNVPAPAEPTPKETYVTIDDWVNLPNKDRSVYANVPWGEYVDLRNKGVVFDDQFVKDYNNGVYSNQTPTPAPLEDLANKYSPYDINKDGRVNAEDSLALISRPAPVEPTPAPVEPTPTPAPTPAPIPSPVEPTPALTSDDIMRMVVGLGTWTDTQRAAADVNGDGKVDLLDSMALQKAAQTNYATPIAPPTYSTPVVTPTPTPTYSTPVATSAPTPTISATNEFTSGTPQDALTYLANHPQASANSRSAVLNSLGLPAENLPANWWDSDIDPVSRLPKSIQYAAGALGFGSQGVGAHGGSVPDDLQKKYADGGRATSDYKEQARKVALEAGIDPDLYASLISVESSWNPDAVSPTGVRGLAQLTKAAAQDVGVTNRMDPYENLRGGALYLAQKMKQFPNDPRRAVMAYHAGAGGNFNDPANIAYANKVLGTQTPTPDQQPAPTQGGVDQSLFADALANVRAQRSALDDMLAKYAEQGQGDKSDMYLRLAAALGSPTRTGTFGETIGNAATAVAESNKGQREADLKNMMMRLEAQKYKTESAKEELAAAIASSKEAQAEKRWQVEHERQRSVDARAALHMSAQEAKWKAEANNISQQASNTGFLSPEAIDVSANLYVQTGSLPSFGFGKNAAEMRAKVLNRAAEISAGKAPSAEESASNIVSAKQKTAATAAMRKDLATGTTSRSINAINTADQHAGLLLELSRAQQNGDMQAINRITNSIATQFGDPSAKNVDVAAAILSREIGKTMSTTAGTAHEAEEMTRQFGSINSIAQAAGVAQTARKLMQGKMDAIRLQGRSNGVPSDELESHFNPSLRIQPPKAPAKQPAGQVVDSRGWVLHQDKNGVKFYLSPDGKQYSRVQ